MNVRRHVPILLGLVLAAGLAAQADAAQGARLTFDVSALEKQAKNVVDVTITPQTMAWARQAMGQRGEDSAELDALLKDIEQVVVRVLEFEEARPWEELARVADPILQQMKSSGWMPVVSVSQNKKEGREVVNVSLYSDPAGKPGGLAVLVVEPKQLVIVNVAGPLDPAKLSQVMKALNLPDFQAAAAGAHKQKAKEKDADKGDKEKEKEKDKEPAKK